VEFLFGQPHAAMHSPEGVRAEVLQPLILAHEGFIADDVIRAPVMAAHEAEGQSRVEKVGVADLRTTR